MLSPTAPLENLRGRPRSGSLMKVEEVATDSFEDQSAYVNINAEWVNRKGTHGLFYAEQRFCFIVNAKLSSAAYRRMADTSGAHHCRENLHRLPARDDPGN